MPQQNMKSTMDKNIQHGQIKHSKVNHSINHIIQYAEYTQGR